MAPIDPTAAPDHSKYDTDFLLKLFCAMAIEGLLPAQSVAAALADVSDRAGRLLGHVTVDSLPAVSGTVSVSNFPTTDPVNLVQRMLAKAPQSGYTLYADIADANYIYIAECPVGSATNTGTHFAGIRVSLTSGGIGTNSAFDWDSRSSAVWTV